MREAQARERNHQWKGGRSIASNGYVLVKVGTEHHLADVRGYAYEHRLVAEEKLGRALLPGEQVHHVDGDKQNNDPSNLEVVTHAEHGVAHRAPRSRARMPGEPNPTVLCGCGCGERFDRYDRSGRPRDFVPGHNPQAARLREAVMAALASGPKSRSEIATACAATVKSVACALTRLRSVRRARPIGRGLWSADV